MRLADFAAAIQPLDVARGDGVPGVRPYRGDARIERRRAAAQRVERQRRGDVCGVRGDLGFAERKRRKCEHRLGAVEQREAFLRLEHQRRDSRGAQRFRARHGAALVHGAAFADRHLRQMRERCEIARRADGTLRRNHGMHAAVEHGHESFRDHRPHAGKSLGDGVGP